MIQQLNLPRHWGEDPTFSIPVVVEEEDGTLRPPPSASILLLDPADSNKSLFEISGHRVGESRNFRFHLFANMFSRSSHPYIVHAIDADNRRTAVCRGEIVLT
jgi:hypothetical protein